MVRLGGMAPAATLPMMAFATIYFRYTKLASCLKPSRISDAFLWIASIAILIVALYAVPDSLSKIFAYFAGPQT
jgi:manganese transport protein